VYINTKGSLAEAVAATSFAIEGIAGDIAHKVLAGFESYKAVRGVEMGPKTSKWFREHAHYDDVHPKIAMEIVKRYATTDRTQSASCWRPSAAFSFSTRHWMRLTRPTRRRRTAGTG